MFEARKFYSIGGGGSGYTEPVPSGGGAVTAANNGLSISGTTVQLGGPLGSSTAANLINNREINLNSNTLTFTGFGAVVGCLIQLRQSVVAQSRPQFAWQNQIGTTTIAMLRVDTSDVILNTNGSQGAQQNNLFNTIIGLGNTTSGAGTAITVSAIHNSFYGAFSGGAITNGIQNCAFGYASLDQGDGSSSSAFGDHALGSVFGSSNTAIGQASLSGSVTSYSVNQVTALGASSGQQSPTAVNDIYIGYKCFFNGNATGSPGGNVIIGSLTQSVTINSWVGGGNIVIGSNINSAGGVGVGSNNIWIGANIVFSTFTQMSNSTVIGHDINIGIGGTVVLGRADQNVIIGTNGPVTAQPGSKLVISGSLAMPSKTTTVSYSLAANDYIVYITGGSGLTITFPTDPASTGRIYGIINQTASNATHVPGFIPFAGGTSANIGANNGSWFQFDGTNWNEIAI